MAKLRSIFGLFLLVALGFALWRILPPIYTNLQFQEWITDEARTASYSRISDRELQTEVADKAEQMGIAIPPENLDARRVRGGVEIKAEYDVTVDLLGYDLKLKFSPQAQNNHL